LFLFFCWVILSHAKDPRAAQSYVRLQTFQPPLDFFSSLELNIERNFITRTPSTRSRFLFLLDIFL